MGETESFRECPTFHAFVATLDYPMFVVTAAVDERRSGCLVGFATQCSIQPPRFAVCISRANHTHALALAADVLAVHGLTNDDQELAERFGGQTGDEVDKFAGVAWRFGPRGAVLLTDCPRWFVGRVVARHDVGDHTLHVLAPLSASVTNEDAPELDLTRVEDLPPGHPA